MRRFFTERIDHLYLAGWLGAFLCLVFMEACSW
jgi:hypothetical protein